MDLVLKNWRTNRQQSVRMLLTIQIWLMKWILAHMMHHLTHLKHLLIPVTPVRLMAAAVTQLSDNGGTWA